jgi:small subunit ribosomal protein S5
MKEKTPVEEMPPEGAKPEDAASVAEEEIPVAEEEVKNPREIKPELTRQQQATLDALGAWKPKTALGKAVKAGEITDIDEIISKGKKLLEPEIVDTLLPNLENELALIGQAKGKFGGGQRRIFKQTQKKTAEGNVPTFTTMAIVGNKDGFVGLGLANSKETVPARNKAIRQAKLNLIKISRSCGSWECGCGNPHSIPLKVSGKCGSVRIVIMPAPKGTGLCIEKECAKLLAHAGIKDVWSKTYGHTKTKSNLIKACFDALKQLMEFKIPDAKRQEIVEGSLLKVKNGN